MRHEPEIVLGFCVALFCGFSDIDCSQDFPTDNYLFGNLPPLLIHSSIVANGVKFSVLP